MADNATIAVIGAGELGQAIGKLLRENGSAVEFWDSDLQKVPGQKSLQETVRPAAHVFFCIPSWGMREALGASLAFFAPSATVVSFAKGIEKDSLKTASELMDEILAPNQPRVFVGGPMLAGEIAVSKKAIGVIASRDAAARTKVLQLLMSPHFAGELSDDPFSVSLAGALKNIYAVLLGLADGLKLSGNVKGWLASHALHEMTEVATSLGANAAAILDSAGAADFLATGYSPYSRNRAIGFEIAKNGIEEPGSEGLVSLPFLLKRLGQNAAVFPLLTLIKEVGIEKKSPATLFAEYV